MLIWLTRDARRDRDPALRLKGSAQDDAGIQQFKMTVSSMSAPREILRFA